MLTVDANGLTRRVKSPTLHEIDFKLDQIAVKIKQAIRAAQKGLS